jgi:hypothetical protein
MGTRRIRDIQLALLEQWVACFCATKASDEWYAHANAVDQPAMIDLVRDAFEQGKVADAGHHAG